MLEIIKDETKGSAQDKLRLFVAYYLSLDGDLTKEEVLHFEHALGRFGCDMQVVAFIKHFKSLHRIAASIASPALPTARSSGDLLGRFSSKASYS